MGVGREASNRWPLLWDYGHRGLVAFQTCRFCVRNLLPFPLATAWLMGDVLTYKQSGDKMFLSSIIPAIGSARWTPKKSAKSQLFENSSSKFDPPSLFKKTTMFTPLYWHRRVISANTIDFGEGEALQTLCNAFPIRQDIAYWLGL